MCSHVCITVADLYSVFCNVVHLQHRFKCMLFISVCVNINRKIVFVIFTYISLVVYSIKKNLYYIMDVFIFFLIGQLAVGYSTTDTKLKSSMAGSTAHHTAAFTFCCH